jgi:hypothetical protein
MPQRARNLSSGQKAVKLDFSRFAPTKAVTRNQPGFTHQPSARERRMKTPAKHRMMRSSHTGSSLR